MTPPADLNYDPGFVNSPGKGQSPTNPLGSVFIQSLGVVSDLSVYRDIFTGSTVNAEGGYTLGVENFMSKEGFQISPPGVFQDDVSFAKDITVGGNVYITNNVTVTGEIIMNGKSFRPLEINTISGPHLVLAAY